MITKQPLLAHAEAFTVCGLSVRTINRDEFNPQTAKLSTLWDQFLVSDMANSLTNKRADSPIFAVYSHYESDASGFYTVTVGFALNTKSQGGEHPCVQVPSGDYLVFTGKGSMPQAVVETWQRVWAYFNEHSDYTRSYSSDYEVYENAEEISIYIGVNQ